ncbi:hypothetical protein ACIOK4_17010 [Streptomyces bottropensis]|uniref:hypothetical protein n=1 Tax=Streptomyces bottropensis TaxID=42235 RepID=UPI00380C120A
MPEHHDHHQPSELDGQASDSGGGSSTLSRLTDLLETSTLAEATRRCSVMRSAGTGRRAPDRTRPVARTRTTGCSSTPSPSPAVEFKRPGLGRRPFEGAGWERALNNYRPFLSDSDLDKIISGKPSELYDSVATVLGLGELTTADERLHVAEKTLSSAVKTAEAELPARSVGPGGGNPAQRP